MNANDNKLMTVSEGLRKIREMRIACIDHKKDAPFDVRRSMRKLIARLDHIERKIILKTTYNYNME